MRRDDGGRRKKRTATVHSSSSSGGGSSKIKSRKKRDSGKANTRIEEEEEEEEEGKGGNTQDMKQVPEWVKVPAAAGAGAPDPMEGIKTCLFAGKTLPECTESFRVAGPQSGVQGLQALLVKGMDNEVANMHARAASIVGHATSQRDDVLAGPCVTVSGAAIKGSAAHVGELLKISNATQEAVMTSKKGWAERT